MNPQVPDELISAYFDGEVSPDEREAVERLLATSDEAQRELNETARLSALLHSFPRESAPAELAGNIQRQTAQLPMPSRTPSPATPSSRHVWLQLRAAFVSCITTAAVFAIVVNMTETSPRRGAPVGLTDNTRTSAEPSSAPDVAMADAVTAFGPAGGMGQPLADMNEKEFLRGPSEASKQSAPRPTSATPAGGDPLMRRAEGTADAERFPQSVAGKAGPGKADLRDAGAATQSFGNAGAAAGAAPSQTAPVDAPQIDNYSNLLSNQSFLEKLQEGKMYTFVPQAADPENNAAVVDLMVVDIDRATEQILVLLGKPENQPRDGSSTGKAKRAGDDLVVVYAVAPADRLAQALNDVTQHPDIVDWSSQLPLNLAGNPALAESLSKKQQTASKPSADKRQEPEMAEAQQFVDALVLRSNSGQLAGPVANPAAPQSLAGGKDGTQNPLPQAAKNSTTDRKKGVAEQRNAVSSGKVDYEVLHVPLSNSVSQYSPRSRGLPPQYGGFENQAGRRQIASVAQLPAEKSVRNDAGNRSVRMLFVLHPAQSDAGSQAPAAKPDK